MSLINRLKENRYNKSLPSSPARAQGKPVYTLDKAKSIGIFFDATDVDQRNKILAYADRLRKKGKKVSTLGYIATADKEATFSFDFYTQRHIDWAQRPKSDTIQHWCRQSFDLLISLFPQTSKPSEHIVLRTAAHFKIGPRAVDLRSYDLMIDLPKGATPQDLIKGYEQIFQLAKQPSPALVS